MSKQFSHAMNIRFCNMEDKCHFRQSKRPDSNDITDALTFTTPLTYSVWQQPYQKSPMVYRDCKRTRVLVNISMTNPHTRDSRVRLLGSKGTNKPLRGFEIIKPPVYFHTWMRFWVLGTTLYSVGTSRYMLSNASILNSEYIQMSLHLYILLLAVSQQYFLAIPSQGILNRENNVLDRTYTMQHDADANSFHVAGILYTAYTANTEEYSTAIYFYFPSSQS